MKKMRRILSILLSILMIISLFPTSVLANEGVGEGFCPHGMDSVICPECNGGGSEDLCSHGLNWSECPECNGGMMGCGCGCPDCTGMEGCTCSCGMCNCNGTPIFGSYSGEQEQISTNTVQVGQTLTITGRVYVTGDATYIVPSVYGMVNNGFVVEVSNDISDNRYDNDTGRYYYQYTLTFEALEEGTECIEIYIGPCEFNGHMEQCIAGFTVNVEGISDIPVSELMLDEKVLDLYVDETAQLHATVGPENATDKTVSWSSDNEAIASVVDGRVTAVAAGTCTITAHAGTKIASCVVTVTIPVAEVALDRESAILEIGVAQKLVATITPENASNKKVTWNTDDAEVATVEDGLVTAVAAGSCIITVTTQDGEKNAQCAVTVVPPVIRVTSVSLERDNLSIEVGKTAQLVPAVAPEDATDKSVTWSSDNNSIATVDENGLVTAVGQGACTISVITNDGGLQATCVVTVSEPAVNVTDVKLDRESLTLNVDETARLTASIIPKNASDKSISWASDNSDIATVDQNGLVKAISAGACTITVTSTDGNITASCAVNVNAPIAVETVSLNYSELDLIVGNQQQLTVEFSPENATNKTVTWISDHDEVASVNDSGLVTAKSAGSCSISVRTADGNITAACAVIVKEAGENHSITCNPAANGIVTADKETAAAGEIVTITTGADTGYALNTLKVNGTDIEITDGVVSYTFAMPDSDVVITAEFTKIYYNIDLNIVGSGTVDIRINGVATTQNIAAYGDEIVIKLVPDSGYKTVGLSGVTFKDEKVTQYVFDMPANHVSLTAQFEAYSWDGTLSKPVIGSTASVIKKENSGHDYTIRVLEGTKEEWNYAFKYNRSGGFIIVEANMTVPAGSVKYESTSISGMYDEGTVQGFDSTSASIFLTSEGNSVSTMIKVASYVWNNDGTVTITPIQNSDLTSHGYRYAFADTDNITTGVYYFNVALDPTFTDCITITPDSEPSWEYINRVSWIDSNSQLRKSFDESNMQISVYPAEGQYMDTVTVASAENPTWDVCTIHAPGEGWQVASVVDNKGENAITVSDDRTSVVITKPVFEPYKLINVNSPTEYTIVWAKEGQANHTEKFTLVMRGDIQIKKLWSPALASITITADALRANGISANYDPATGILNATIDGSGIPSLDALTAKAVIPVPDGAEQYKAVSGYGDLNDGTFADEQHAYLDALDPMPIDGAFDSGMPLFEYEINEIGGVEYAVSTGDEDRTRFIICEFYDANGNYISGSYMMGNSDEFSFESSSTGQEQITSPVSEPTIEGSDATLNITYYPQKASNGGYLMDLTTSATGAVTIYIPYSITGLSYEELRYGTVTIRHYYNGANDSSYETLTGECTEYGIKFVMDSFSPIILHWEKGEKVDEIIITKQPVDCTVNKGEKASFSVEATGVGLKYQWYYRNKGVETWSIWSGKITAAITTGTTASSNGRQVKCVITDASGNTLESAAATIMFPSDVKPIVITKQPQNVTINKGDKATFEVMATGDSLSYQWYYRNKGATSWSIWTGKTSNVLTTTTYNSSRERDVYCMITDRNGNSIESDVATMFFN